MASVNSRINRLLKMTNHPISKLAKEKVSKETRRGFAPGFFLYMAFSNTVFSESLRCGGFMS